MKLRRWIVATPEFTAYEYHNEGFIVDAEEVCDWVEIEAQSAPDAIAMGVKEMLRIRNSWCSDQRLSGCSPYTGVRAELV